MLLAIAGWLRVQGLAESSALGDAIHPWWAAVRTGVPRPHAPPYGWALVLPYKLCLWEAGGLWEAVLRMAWLHALAAPVAFFATLGAGGRPLVAILVGLGVAVDPGLLDTVWSGAEGYLGPVWLGLALVGIAYRSRPWGLVLAWVAWALAVLHHPMAVAALPLVLSRPWKSKSAGLGMVAAGVLLAPRIYRLWMEPELVGGTAGAVVDAFDAYVTQGGALAVAVLLGPCIGLFSARTRWIGIRVLVCLLGLCIVGFLGGYLRDHHIRLLTIPGLVGWAAIPWPALGALIGLTVWPGGDDGPAALKNRPGTLGLAHQLTDWIATEVPPPAIVDGAWISGGPAASPAALMLDLHLRGWSAEDLTLREAVVVVVSGEREDMASLEAGGLMIHRGERHALLVGTPSAVSTWSTGHCDARLGGAWDALSVLHPEMGVEETRQWWACP